MVRENQHPDRDLQGAHLEGILKASHLEPDLLLHAEAGGEDRPLGREEGFRRDLHGDEDSVTYLVDGHDLRLPFGLG
jgi:hypothetical protein